MKRFSLILLSATALIVLSAQVNAQVLYKYVDANGKVTYSDKAPKPGEKAERITADTTTNIINSPAGVRAGAGSLASGGKETSADAGVRTKARAAERECLPRLVRMPISPSTLATRYPAWPLCFAKRAITSMCASRPATVSLTRCLTCPCRLACRDVRPSGAGRVLQRPARPS